MKLHDIESKLNGPTYNNFLAERGITDETMVKKRLEDLKDQGIISPEDFNMYWKQINDAHIIVFNDEVHIKNALWMFKNNYKNFKLEIKLVSQEEKIIEKTVKTELKKYGVTNAVTSDVIENEIKEVKKETDDACKMIEQRVTGDIENFKNAMSNKTNNIETRIGACEDKIKMIANRISNLTTALNDLKRDINTIR